LFLELIVTGAWTIFLAVYVTELFSHRAVRIASTLLANVGWNW
jgi:hypothetical protein